MCCIVIIASQRTSSLAGRRIGLEDTFSRCRPFALCNLQGRHFAFTLNFVQHFVLNAFKRVLLQSLSASAADQFATCRRSCHANVVASPSFPEVLVTVDWQSDAKTARAVAAQISRTSFARHHPLKMPQAVTIQRKLGKAQSC